MAGKYTLPDLPYDYSALEPHIDAKTMEIHHTKHHQTYIDKLNAALEGHDDLYTENVDDLLRNFSNVPADIQGAVRNHGGGHSNHSLFWTVMGPDGGGEPSGDLAAAIDDRVRLPQGDAGEVQRRGRWPVRFRLGVARG